MFCPKCGYQLFCGCENCKDKLPENHKSEIWEDDMLVCPNCNFKKNIDWWEKIDYDIAVGNFNNLTEMVEANERKN